MKVLYGEIPLMDGHCSVMSYDMRKMSVRQLQQLRRSIGIIFQDFQLLMDRTTLCVNAPIEIKSRSTDAYPIIGNIKYDGEYGEFTNEDYMLNNRLSSITINQDGGINANEQLAFLRTYSVRQYIENYIDAFRNTKNVFQHYCEVAKEKGGQYRKIAVEITIHNAFKGKQLNEITESNTL